MKKSKKVNYIIEARRSLNKFAKYIRELNAAIRIFHYVYDDIRNRKII